MYVVIDRVIFWLGSLPHTVCAKTFFIFPHLLVGEFPELLVKQTVLRKPRMRVHNTLHLKTSKLIQKVQNPTIRLDFTFQTASYHILSYHIISYLIYLIISHHIIISYHIHIIFISYKQFTFQIYIKMFISVMEKLCEPVSYEPSKWSFANLVLKKQLALSMLKKLCSIIIIWKWHICQRDPSTQFCFYFLHLIVFNNLYGKLLNAYIHRFCSWNLQYLFEYHSDIKLPCSALKITLLCLLGSRSALSWESAAIA